MARTIIMAEDVAAMAEGGRLVIDDNTTVTASARELARRRNIELVAGAGPAAGGAGGAGRVGVRSASVASHAAMTDAALAAQREGEPPVSGGVPGTIIVTAAARR